jgi:hypothetical protein
MNNHELLEIKREQFARNWGPGRDQTGSRPLFETELAALLDVAQAAGQKEAERADGATIEKLRLEIGHYREMVKDCIGTLSSVDEWLSRCGVEDEPYFDLAVEEVKAWREAMRGLRAAGFGETEVAA